ncbi:lmo0937 family membrane protein [bacterium]|nr:MAG: lmo0937 family membrane protein [bacterium]
MLWAIIVILVILWLLGWLAFHVGGGLIHLLIVVAVILFIWNLITGRGARI